MTNTPAATPSPTAPNPLAIPVFGYDFWAGDTQVDYYTVTGRTEEAILASIARNGPYSAWIGGHAEAETRATYNDYWYLLPLGDGSCHVVRPPLGEAISASFVVTLPAWTRPSSADPSVVRWWVSELTADAEHENHHIELYETYITLMNGVVRDGNCATIPDAIQSLRNQVATAQCEYDLAEYGHGLGLTLDSCLAHLSDG